MATVNGIEIIGAFAMVRDRTWVRMSSVNAVIVSVAPPRFHVLLRVSTAEFSEDIYLECDSEQAARNLARDVVTAFSHG